MSTEQPHQNPTASRSHSRSRNRDSHPSRPTTPLRSSSRESLRRGSTVDNSYDALLPCFEELDDAMAQLHDNFYALQQMHESITKFNENFASMLYGLNMNAFCVDFVESPMPESFRRAQQEAEELARAAPAHTHHGHQRHDYDAETTFMTNDTFVEQPPAPPANNHPKTPKRGGGRGIPAPSSRGGRGGPQVGRARGSGIARGRAGVRGTTTR